MGALLPQRSNHAGVGGERGIRTLEGLLALTPLAGVRLRPLGHLSVMRLIYANVILLGERRLRDARSRATCVRDNGRTELDCYGCAVPVPFTCGRDFSSDCSRLMRSKISSRWTATSRGAFTPSRT